MILAQESSQAVGPVAPLLFYAFAALVAGGAWAIVLSPNIVRMSIFLLFTLVGVGSLYFMLEAELLGAIQFVVYAGGTLILIVFGVMLTSNSPMANLKVSRFELILGSILAVVIGASLLMSLALTKLPESISVLAPVSSEDQVALVGRALLGGYVLPFEVAGVLLLVVMVGAAFMARKRADKHRAVAATATAPQTESASVSSH